MNEQIPPDRPRAMAPGHRAPAPRRPAPEVAGPSRVALDLGSPRAVLAVAVVATTAILGGCAADTQDEEPYSAVADVAQLMSAILEPAADHYWDAVGWIDEDGGTTEIVPRTEDEWAAVRNAAFVIAESGNLLLMPERVPDDPAWIPMAQALVDVGRQAIEAAEFREPLEVFNVGAEVYYVCTNCHARFAVETLPPADERADPGEQ